MGTKTISIMDDAYELLKRNKSEDESFSDVIRAMAKRKGSILDCAGLWSDIGDKEAEEMVKAIKKTRKSTIKRLAALSTK